MKGFQKISELQVLHRDLKLPNILVHFKNVDSKIVEEGGARYNKFRAETELIGNVNVVIADLGFAKQLEKEDLTQTQCGTPLYMAPEILRGEKYSTKVDVWSLGAAFYEMLTGITPFTGTSKDDLKRNLDRGQFKFPKGIRMSLEGLDFLNCCLQYNPDDRMDWNQLIKHTYINYDSTKYMGDKGEKPDDLMLSFLEDKGLYTTLKSSDAHNKLNNKNAIMLNTRNPQMFEDVYYKTIQKL